MANMDKKFSLEDEETGPVSEREALLGRETDSEDDFFLKGPNPKPPAVSNMDRVKLQLKEVTDTMRDNVNRLNERGASLDELEGRSAELSSTSDDFRSSAGILRKKARWRAMRMRLMIGFVACVIITVIFVSIYLKSGSP